VCGGAAYIPDETKKSEEARQLKRHTAKIVLHVNKSKKKKVMYFVTSVKSQKEF
jgi:hypothetical protein